MKNKKEKKMGNPKYLKGKRLERKIVNMILIGIGLILVIYWVTPLFFNSGTSTDYPYTIEHTKVGWYKLWLKDDHTTVYCFDDDRFLPILEQAKLENKKVAVTYQDYFFRGMLCSSGSERIGTTVITGVQIMEGQNGTR